MTVELRDSQLTIHTNAPIAEQTSTKNTKLTAAYRNSVKNPGHYPHSKQPLATIYEESTGISKEETAVGTIAQSTGLVQTTTAPNEPAVAPQDEYSINIDFDTSLHVRTLCCDMSQNFSLIEKIRSLDFQQQNKATLHLSESEITDLMGCLQNMVDFPPPLSALKNAIENLMLAKMLSQAVPASEPVVSVQPTPADQDKQIRDYVLRFALKDSSLHQIDWDSEEPLQLTPEENAEFLYCLKRALAIHPEYEDKLRPVITDLEPKNPYCKLSKELYFSEGSFVANESPAELAKITLALGFLDLSGTDTSDDDILELAKKHPHIKSLDLSHCNKISNIGLSFLQMLPNLKTVDLSGCENIQPEHIQFPRGVPSSIEFILNNSL